MGYNCHKEMKKITLMLVSFFAVTFAFVSCEPNTPEHEPVFELITKSLTMYVGDIKTIQVTSELEYTIKSDDNYVATTTENKNVKGEHVGKTTITVTNGKKTETCEVEVLAKYHPFTEPFIPNYTTNSCEWLTMSNYNDLHGFEFLENESTSEYHMYKGKEPHVYFIYYFDSSLKISEMRIIFYDVEKYDQTILNYTNERFNYLGIEDGVYKYCNTYNYFYATLKVTLGTYTDGTNTFIMLIYTPLMGNNVIL